MTFFARLFRDLGARGVSFAGTHTLRPISLLNPAEKRAVRSASPRRQAEFATGRWCAGKALQTLGVPAVSIPAGTGGEPVWPDGICGSISHTAGAYCAVAAFSDKYQSLGIDIESRKKKITPGALELIANTDELRWLARAGKKRREREQLLFCAKESAFKTLYPITQKRFSFTALSLLPVTDPGHFILICKNDLFAGFPKGRKLLGRYYADPQWLVAMTDMPRETA